MTKALKFNYGLPPVKKKIEPSCLRYQIIKSSNFGMPAHTPLYASPIHIILHFKILPTPLLSHAAFLSTQGSVWSPSREVLNWSSAAQLSDLDLNPGGGSNYAISVDALRQV